MARPRKNLETVQAPAQTEAQVGTAQLAEALVQAINATKPKAKKTAANRVPQTPWSPKDGSPRLKLKRKMYQHGIPINPEMVTNEVIELLNKIKPGLYCDNWVKVVRRRDKGVDIDYPVRTAAQRLKLVNQFGIRDFKELLQRIITEGNNPKQFKSADEFDD